MLNLLTYVIYNLEGRKPQSRKDAKEERNKLVFPQTELSKVYFLTANPRLC